MARVTYGGGVTEFEGSIGGVTFMRNSSGPIAKLRSRPIVNPRQALSEKQTLFAFLVAYWQALDQSDKDDWDTFAAAHNHTTPWGETKTLSGYQWFLSCNLIRMIYHSTPIDAPPTWTAYSPPDQFTIATSSTYIKVQWSPAYDATSLMAYCTLPLSQNSLNLRHSLYFVKYYFNSPSLSEWDLTTEIAALLNVTWSSFYATSNCSLIIRILNLSFNTGLSSSYTSAITQI